MPHFRALGPGLSRSPAHEKLCQADLRHTCATLLLDNGVHPKFVQHLLGHVSIYNSVYCGLRMQEWDEFEWDDDNEGHLAEHGVDRYEAEEAATDPAAIVKRVGTDRYGNRRYIYVGKTEDSRILFMVVDRKGQRRWRVGSARDAKFNEKRGYRRRNR
jgi:uncharacterized DUF497 family protein